MLGLCPTTSTPSRPACLATALKVGVVSVQRSEGSLRPSRRIPSRCPKLRGLQSALQRARHDDIDLHLERAEHAAISMHCSLPSLISPRLASSSVVAGTPAFA